MRFWPLLFAAALALAVYSGLLRAQNDPPSWATAVYLATVVMVAGAEAMRRSANRHQGGPDGTR